MTNNNINCINKLKDLVYNEVKLISLGSLSTYKTIALKIGYPDNSRLVGKVLSQNRDFHNIPCYRVVKSDGKVGGYALGNENKIEKLRKEGIEIKSGKVMNLKVYLA